MNYKYYVKEFLWITGLYGVFRRWSRKLSSKTVELERQEIEFYQNLIGSDDLIFDVGAHLGDKTNAFLACGAKVVVIEPETRLINHIKWRFSDNSRIHMVNKGLSAKPEKLPFYRRNAASASGCVKDWDPKLENITKVLEIETTTLDLLIEEFGIPKYIKIDVEGFEVEVLRGLSHLVPLISFEFFNNQLDRAFECMQLLSQFGELKFNFTSADESQLVLEKWLPRKEFEEFITGWNQDKFESRGDIYAKVLIKT